MGLIDLILNVACVLLWFNWRSAQVATFEKSPPVTLASTIKQVDTRHSGRWFLLLALLGLLMARSFVYWKLGAAWRWTPTLELGVIRLPFRSDFLARIVAYSWLSFALLLGTIYAWLILLSIINRRVAGDEPLQKLVRLHLGWIDRWPPLLQAALPALITAAIWGFSHSSLVRLGIVPVPSSQAQVWQEALLLGVSSWLVWKPLVLLLCVLYVIQSYVYLGEAPFWRFINTSGTNLLGPLRRLPIAIGKLDLAPLVVMALVFGIGHWAARWLPKLFQQLPLP